jgi:aspartate/methionine/tyrosine aminotransferase
MHASLDALVSRGRMDRYTLPTGDSHERTVLAELVNRYAGSEVFEADDVLATTGSTEGIGLLFMAMAEIGDIELALPLPAYFAYELSAVRWGLPIATYYDPANGRRCLASNNSRRRTAVIINSPESVTGLALSQSAMEEVAGQADPEGLVIYDCIYQLEDLAVGSPGLSSRDVVRRAVADREKLERSVLLFTASKDLSLPGLRAGLIVTKNLRLKKLLNAILMERYYAGPPLPAYVMALYLSVLCAGTGARASDAVLSLLAADGPTTAAASDSLSMLTNPAAVAAHRARMLAHFEAGFRTVTEQLDAGSDGSIRLGPRPSAGYSTTLELPPEYAASSPMASLAQTWLRGSELRVYPHLVFGGNDDAWATLHPGRAFVRLNVSGDLNELADGVDRLCSGIRTHTDAERQR